MHAPERNGGSDLPVLVVGVEQGVDLSVHACRAFHHRVQFPELLGLLWIVRYLCQYMKSLLSPAQPVADQPDAP